MKFDIIFEALSFAKKHKKWIFYFILYEEGIWVEVIAWKCIKSNIIKSDMHRDEINKIPR